MRVAGLRCAVHGVWGRSRQEGYSESHQPLSSQADAPGPGLHAIPEEASGAVSAGRAEFHNLFLEVLCLDDYLRIPSLLMTSR
jgi:hypothetical protein